MKLSRRTFLSTAGAALAAPAGTRPNILFLFTDDQRFSTLNALNNPEVRTPNMDRLVRRGVAFTHACIMGSTVPAVCAPSRAMLMTGQSLFHINDSIISPKPAARTFHLFPELLRGNGYRTFGTGKWHNGERLFARCFSDGGNIFFGGMADHLKTPVAPFDPSGAYPAASRQPGSKFSSELFSDSAISFLNGHNTRDPFLMYVSYTSPHDPRMAPSKYTAMYPWEKIALPKNYLPEHPFDNGEMRIRDENLAPFPRTPEIVKQHIAAYYAMISEVDEQIGRVLNALEKSPHARNTIIVFAGDNGLAVGQHGLMGKQNLYDHSVRVPLVIAGPGIPAGRRRDSLCYLMDLFPTLCDFTGVPTPGSVEGKSLLPVIRGTQKQIRDSVFFAYTNVQRAVRTDRWKLIVYNVKGQTTIQLFDVLNDPYETRNLAAEPAHASQVAELQALLKQHMAQLNDPSTL
jgi:arylsulfatase A-like enzyme